MTDDSVARCCGTCSAWRSKDGQHGECCAAPPTSIVIGMQEIPARGKGVMMPGAQEMMVQPVIQAVWPRLKATGWCRQWEARADAAQKTPDVAA